MNRMYVILHLVINPNVTGSKSDSILVIIMNLTLNRLHCNYSMITRCCVAVERFVALLPNDQRGSLD